MNYVVLAALAALYAWALWHGGLFSQDVWYAGAGTRIAVYAAAYAGWVALLRLFRPAVFVYATAAATLLLAALEVGPLAVLAPVAILAAAWTVGRRFLDDDLLAAALGLGVLMTVVWAAVHFPVNRPWVYWAVLLGLAPLAPRVRFPGRSGSSAVALPSFAWSARERLLAEFAGLFLVAHFLFALKPEVSSDGQAMHLVVPARVLFDARWHFDVTQFSWAVMPMGGDWLWTLAYLMGGEFAARLLNAGLLLLLALLTYRLANAAASRPVALLAVILFASAPLTQLVTGSLYVENVWGVYILAALAAVGSGHALAAGVLLGFAMATKFGAFAFALPVMAVLALRLGRRAALPAAALALAVAAPAYIEAALRTGNPLFPFFNDIFKGRHFPTDIGATFYRYRQGLRPAFLYEATFRTREYLEALDGGFAFHVLAAAVLAVAILGRRWPWVAGAAAFTALAATLLTFPAQAYVRYIYPAVALAAVLFATALARWNHRALWSFAALLVALNAYFFTASGWYHRDFLLPPFRPDLRTAYLRQSAPGRLLVRWLNEHAPGEPVLFLEDPQYPELRGRAWLNGWHQMPFLLELEKHPTPPAAAALLQSHGIRYVVAPAPGSGRDVRHVTLRELLRAAAVVHREGAWQIVRLPAAASPRMLETPASGRFEDSDPRIRYGGAWLFDPQFESASGGSITYSERPGDSVVFRFRGTHLRYGYTQAFNRGRALVEIDGVGRGTVDLYSRELRWQSSTAFGGLAPGIHEAKITVLPERHRRSAGGYVDVDYFEVDGAGSAHSGSPSTMLRQDTAGIDSQ